MGFLKYFYAAGLAVIFLLQTAIISLNLVESGIRLPGGSSALGLFRRQEEEVQPVYTYRGHTCHVEPKTEPVPDPGIPHCEPTPTEHIRDAHQSKVQRVANFFCGHYFSENITTNQDPAIMPISATLYASNRDKEFWPVYNVYQWDYEFEQTHVRKRDDIYYVTIDWREGCSMEDLPPTTQTECQNRLYYSWSRCNNKGRGGMLEWGCLKYSIVTVY